MLASGAGLTRRGLAIRRGAAGTGTRLVKPCRSSDTIQSQPLPS